MGYALFGERLASLFKLKPVLSEGPRQAGYPYHFFWLNEKLSPPPGNQMH